jgi:hypothetical protein
MSLAETVYSARFRTSETIERGRTQILSCPTSRAGATATPTSGTISIYRPDGTALVSAQAVTIPGGGVAQYSLPGASTTSEALGEGWLIEWSLVMPDTVVHTFRQDAALCRRQLYPVISQDDLTQRHSDLPSILGSAASYQPYIDEAWWTIGNRLIAAGRRPYLVIQPSALRDCHLMLALHLVFLDYSTSAGDGGRWQALASHYLTTYEQAWGQLRFSYDETDENRIDTSKRKGATSQVWTNGRGLSAAPWARYGG